MKNQPDCPAKTWSRGSGNTAQRYIAFFVALILCLSWCLALAEAPASPGGTAADTENTETEELPFDEGASDGEGGSGGFPMDEDGEVSSGLNGFGLTDENFAADDVPEEYLLSSKQPGRVEKVTYTTSAEEEDTKACYVYLPAGYDDTDHPYNVMYITHASNGSAINYLNPARSTNLQDLLDHMIANGELEPLIVVACTYYPTEGITKYLPLPMQVEVTAKFPAELVNDIIPAVESVYRTYAASGSMEDIVASRAHRAIVGFSLGGVATWYVFLQEMRSFMWFLPISEASWDDGDGGTSGIWDSDVSAQVLYDAVVEQGYAKNDFRLFVATGTEDEAFDIATSQMASLLEYDDMFKPGENTACCMMNGGTHTLKAVYTYLYHIIPSLFAGLEPAAE